MREMMRNFTILVQRIGVVLLIVCGASLGIAGSQTERQAAGLPFHFKVCYAK
jgi:hypothetical protein